MKLCSQKFRLSGCSFSLIALYILFQATLAFCAESSGAGICKPELLSLPRIEIGNAGLFRWVCNHGESAGEGFYIVFIRPSGTYVLLKVPKGRNTFEFTPDVPGTWRWMVINTHPDRTKPDVESAPGFFEVFSPEERKH